VLDEEETRWSALSCQQLIADLREGRTYQIESESKHYQVEVMLLEDTVDYVHVSVSVDDGSLPQSLVPLTHSFMKQKCAAPASSESAD